MTTDDDVPGEANLLTRVGGNKCFGGEVVKYKHTSMSLSCDMELAVFLPPQACEGTKCPVLIFLAGLTCTSQNFITKAGAIKKAAEENMILVCPDTSPRGDDVPDHDGWDHGKGAGFYVNATQEPFKKHYHMFDYINVELYALIVAQLPALEERIGIFGHSMGGHGALISALKNPGLYQSVSAFAAIANPVECPWGDKNFTGYLGKDKEVWKAYDATHLATTYDGPNLNILLDQGEDDQFYTDKQLLPENLQMASLDNSRLQVALRFHDGYDHSYYFISSFIDDHIAHHARILKV